MIKVSVIVPVYNCEKYLAECLESLINQSLRDIEIICINDGSIDLSLSILNNYAFMDPRIKIFSQENKGASSARNIGIENAIGEYISFIDADDFIDLNTYEIAYSYVNNNQVDLIISGINIYNSISGIKLLAKFKNKIYSEKTKGSLYPNIVGVCNFFIKRKIIYENSIKFAEDIGDGEDRLFANIIFCYCKRIMTITNIFYYYRKDGQLSITNGYIYDSYKRKMFYLDITKKTINIWNNKDRTKLNNKKLLYRTLWLICEGAENIKYLEINKQIDICNYAATILNNKYFLNIRSSEINKAGISQLRYINSLSKQDIIIIKNINE